MQHSSAVLLVIVIQVGPIVSASTPLLQSDGYCISNMVIFGLAQLMLENYPAIYSIMQTYNSNQILGLLDKADQTTEEGVLFADARQGDTGGSKQMHQVQLLQNYLTSQLLRSRCSRSSTISKRYVVMELTQEWL